MATKRAFHDWISLGLKSVPKASRRLWIGPSGVNESRLDYYVRHWVNLRIKTWFNRGHIEVRVKTIFSALLSALTASTLLSSAAFAQEAQPRVGRAAAAKYFQKKKSFTQAYFTRF